MQLVFDTCQLISTCKAKCLNFSLKSVNKHPEQPIIQCGPMELPYEKVARVGQ